MLGSGRNIGGGDLVEALKELAQGLGKKGLLRTVQGERKFSRHPGHDRPRPGEGLTGMADGNDVGDGSRQIGCEAG